MITLTSKNKEVEVSLVYSQELGSKPSISIEAKGDLSHHLIEGVFDILDKLAKMENCSHQSNEWRKK
jgi:hypothetical protein